MLPYKNKQTLFSALTVLALTLPRSSVALTPSELLQKNGVASTSPSRLYYKNGTRMEFGDSGTTLGFNTFLQTRYDFTDHDDADDISSFRINRARLIVSGSLLEKEWEYYFQHEFAGTSPTLKDGYMRWNASPDLALRLGQYKIPVTRQYVNSDQAIQLADRSVASDYFDLDRNQGADFAFMATPTLKLGAAIFNGISTGESPNGSAVDTNHTGALTFRSDILGKMDAYKEGDVEYTEGLAFNVGGAYTYSDFETSSEATSHRQNSKQSIALDANLKSEGESLHAEVFYGRDDAEEMEPSSPVGGYIQGGYLLGNKTTELAARYSLLSCDNGTALGECSGVDSIQEVALGLNYFINGHNLKAQLNYVYKRTSPEDDDRAAIDDNRVVLQLTSFL